MKNVLISLLVVLGFASVSSAQLFEAVANPNVIAGATYRLDNPGTGANRTSFLLSANVAGIKLGTLPVYLGGVGVDLRSLSPAFEQFGSAISLTIPGVTYYLKGNKFCAQVGYSYALSGTETRNGVYAGVGFAWNSPNYLEYRRAAKRAKKAGVALPPNPYEVK